MTKGTTEIQIKPKKGETVKENVSMLKGLKVLCL